MIVKGGLFVFRSEYDVIKGLNANSLMRVGRGLILIERGICVKGKNA